MRTALISLIASALALSANCGDVAARYGELVATSQPVAFWRFNEADAPILTHPKSSATFSGTTVGGVRLRQAGPRPELFGDFETDNTAVAFDGQGARVVVKDPGANSPLDFGLGDSITLEAWVLLKEIRDNQNIYIVGKGRTNNAGMAVHNQNYGLRLRGVDNAARLSFIFRRANAPHSDDPREQEKYWHRWTTVAGFRENTGWHHVALTYTFGKSASIRGYIDGTEIKGVWDNGGPTDAAPVVDDDDLWIGSSMGGSAMSSFAGAIDEVAIYRGALTSALVQSHYRSTAGAHRFSEPDGSNDDGTVGKAKRETAGGGEIPELAAIQAKDLPRDHVRVEVLEGLSTVDSELFASTQVTETYKEDAFAFITTPKKYNRKGIVIDRSNPFAVRAAAIVTLPPGDYRLLLRARNAARLTHNGKVLATIKKLQVGGGGHGEVPETPQAIEPGTRLLQPGQVERLVSIQSTGGEQVIILEALVGGGKLRPEIGEINLAIAAPGQPFRLLAPQQAIPFTDDAWTTYAARQRAAHFTADAARRRKAGEAEAAYWTTRHELARKQIEALPALAIPAANGLPAQNAIDHFLNAKLAAANTKPAALCSDQEFIRRVALDVIGMIPNPQQIDAFLRDQSPDKRAKLIDTYLNDAGWADNWVGYWQDVLAENPGILKPELNNTGPFRWWIREAFADNKPMDRFATELIMMEGSLFGGGPAGFGIASQNDAPMAEKAFVACKAFMAVEMKCARCHDAPHHDLLQQDLFSVAALLRRAPQEVPKTSSIPLDEKAIARLMVNVTLKPGTKVEPTWPFEKLLPGAGKAADIPAGVLRKAEDTREQLAALMTSARNERFAAVLVNRLWQRYLGKGLVDPVDDWETAKPSHPELLQYLSRDLAAHGFDLKHAARLILNSHAYQRKVDAELAQAAADKTVLFAAQNRRRLTGEQMLDSLFAAAGKGFKCEELTFDPEGRQPMAENMNMGTPSRAWELVSLSNERDRPALSLPVAQSLVDVLARFGWRESRQAPTTLREEDPNVLQPAIIANGIIGNRIARLSDDSALTELCLQQRPLPELIKSVYWRVLTREPSSRELQVFTQALQDGYDTRLVAMKDAPQAKNNAPVNVAWSNHLSPEATKIKLEQERLARRGDAPTARLAAPWRERMEDMVWALINSPEFLFVP